jgi:hypothetical protein
MVVVLGYWQVRLRDFDELSVIWAVAMTGLMDQLDEPPMPTLLPLMLDDWQQARR